MTPPRRNANKKLQALTLALTVVVGVALAGITYLSLTSIPYLATSPTTDPVFGTLNACLLNAVQERVGYAVSRDGTRVAAWSPKSLVECAGQPAAATVLGRPGVTLGAYGGDGALWVVGAGTDGGPAGLFRLEGGALQERGALSASALVGTAQGVVVLEPTGNLISVSSTGEVSATRALPAARGVSLQASADGKLVALWGGGKFAVVDAVTLKSTPAEVPCPVEFAWWRPNAPLLVVECLDIVIEVNALDSQSALLEPRRRTHSSLLGPGGTYVQSCDVLPCSVEAPR